MPLSLAWLLLHLLKYCGAIQCGFLVLANAVFASLLHLCWLKDVPGALLWEDLNSTLVQFIRSDAQEKMSVPIIISNWQCWKLFCPCIVIVIYWACALCVPAIIYTHGLGLPGKKKNIYMNLKGLIPVRFFCKAVTDNGNSLLWIFMIECYGNRCSWEPCSNHTGVAVLLIDKQYDESLNLCVKVDSRWKCHFLPCYNYVPLYILFHLEIQCIQLSIFTLFQACSMCIINDSNSLKTFFCCQD